MQTELYDLGKFKIILDKNDLDISEQIRNFGWYEDEKFVTKVFSKNISKNMHILDLGGNIGFYTLYARSIIGSAGKIITFEPFPNNVSLIKRSIIENSFTNVVIVEAAVSDHIGKSALYLSPNYNSEHSLIDFYDNPNESSKKIEVDIITVDSFFEKNNEEQKIDFIKMDIEGSEFHALKGMTKTLECNNKLSILSEFYPNGLVKNGVSPKTFLSELHDLGFSIYHIDDIKQSVDLVSVNELMRIYKIRNRDSSNPYDELWGWHTNILAKRD